MNLKPYKLVISGSGTRFPIFVGALKALYEHGFTFSEVSGTSGGAIIAAGLALGFTIDEIINLCLDVLPNINKLIDPSLISLFWNWGLIKGDIIESLFLKHTKGKKLSETVIPLHVVTVNYDKASDDQPYHILNSIENPNVCIAQAVRASMAIPLVFTPKIIDNDRYIDGGVAASFPIDMFGNSSDVIGLNVVGFGTAAHSKNTPIGIKGFPKYIFDMISILMSAVNKEYLDDANLVKIINLKTNHSSLNFNLKEKDIVDMIDGGYTITKNYLLKLSSF